MRHRNIHGKLEQKVSYIMGIRRGSGTTGSSKIGNGEKRKLETVERPKRVDCFGSSSRDKNGNPVKLNHTKREAGRQHVKENQKKKTRTHTHAAGACNWRAGRLFLFQR